MSNHETRVRLDNWANDQPWPSWVADRIRYDAAHCELAFTGFMTRCDYDILRGVSRDLTYQRAVEELFVRSSQCAAPGERQARAGLLALLTRFPWRLRAT